MRPDMVGALASLVLISPAFLASAEAQQRHIGGGAPAAPHISAPAPAISAPTPHFAPPSPRISAPARPIAPPAPHFSAPQISAQRIAAPHFAAPHPVAPRLAMPSGSAAAAHGIAAGRLTPHGANAFVRHNGGPSVPSGTRLSRHLNNAPATSTARGEGLRGNPSSGAGSLGNNSHGLAPNAPRLAGERQGGTRSVSQTAGLQMHYTGNAPILRNPIFAKTSSRGSATQTQSTFRGNYAQSKFARDWDRHHHHRHFGIVLGFVGPVFWPYAYTDLVDYVYTPYSYDTFWPYAFDDVFEGIYGAYAPEYDAPESDYAYAGAPVSDEAYGHATGRPGGRRTTALSEGGSLICSGQVQSLADFPSERIAQQVEPDQRQRALLDDLKATTAKAVSILQAACPNELPSTPTGRISAMRTRIEAMLQAVETVRPALKAFYQSLNDEQKERFNALDQDMNAAAQQSDITGLCSGPAGRGAGLPVDRIESALRLSNDQDAALKDVNDALAKAADIIKASCQPDQSLTPTGRLAAIEGRLKSMRKALDTIQPALARFYESLNDEQKARFDRLGVRPA